MTQKEFHEELRRLIAAGAVRGVLIDRYGPNMFTLKPSSFPVEITIYSGKTAERLWSRSITLVEATAGTSVEVPDYAGTEHAPVRLEVKLADDD